MTPKLTLLLGVLLAVSATCYADETAPEPFILQRGEITHQPSVCYSTQDHDALLLLWHDDLDALEAAKDQIRELESTISELQAKLDLSGIRVQKAETLAELYQVQRGGFWRRHFRLCGGVGGAVEVLGDQAGHGSLAAFGGLCILP